MKNKNTLWVFGASLSLPFKPTDEIDNGLIQGDGWADLLAKKLDMRLQNLAGAGNSNFEILFKFLTHNQFMKEGDKLIIQFMNWDLIKVFPFNVNVFDLGFDSVQMLGGMEHIQKEDNQTLVRDIFMKNLVRICIQKKVDFRFWFTFEDDRNENLIGIQRKRAVSIPTDKNKFGMFDSWQALQSDQWIVLKDGNFDKHFNEIGHKRFANYLYDSLEINTIH